MGLLSKLTGKVTPQKKPADDALLLHAMLLMCGADGNFDEQELPQVEGYFNALPEFEGKLTGNAPIEDFFAVAGDLMLDAVVEARPPTKRVCGREADIVVHGPGIASVGHHRAEPRAVEA